MITLAVSLVVAGAVLASFYVRLPTIGHFVAAHRMGLLGAAYVVLMLGVVTRTL
ncbi:hypothetical protein JNW90_34850 [Micromonospora sp. STR1s_5]|nr:hypothetical protein [Micromonospora sp. STR1s_5]